MLHYSGPYSHFQVHTVVVAEDSQWEHTAICSDMHQHFLKTHTTELNKPQFSFSGKLILSVTGFLFFSFSFYCDNLCIIQFQTKLLK